MIAVCKTLPILILGTSADEKADFLVQSKQRAKTLSTLTEAVTATKRIAHSLFKSMRQANVGCSQMTLAHYLKSVGGDAGEGGGGGGLSLGGAARTSSTDGASGSGLLRAATLNRGASEASADKDGNSNAVNSSVISIDNVLAVKSSVGPAAVLHKIGIVDEDGAGELSGTVQAMRSFKMDKLVEAGVEFVRQTACNSQLSDSLLEAAGICANVDQGLRAKEMEMYWSNRMGKGSSVGLSGMMEGGRAPPSTPTRAGAASGWGDVAEERESRPSAGIAAADDSSVRTAVAEESRFAAQCMWNYKKCACGCAIMDEEIMDLWEQEDKKKEIKKVKERLMIIGGLSSGSSSRPASMRRNSRGALVGLDGQDGWSLDDMKICVNCPACGREYEPTLYARERSEPKKS
jgi:hypothetical protein